MERVSLQSGMFSGVLSDVDSTLEKAIGDLIEKEYSEVKVTLQISIELEEKVVFKEGQAERRFVPKITYKVSKTASAKEKVKGTVGDGEEELIRGKDEWLIGRAYGEQSSLYD